jgi:hypothetical protein
MRHVSEPVPSVLDKRPDCPVRLDLAIQRAMAKDPEDRFESMDEFVAELEACLAELDGRSEDGATMIVPPTRPKKRPRARQTRKLPVIPVLLALLAAALVVAGAYLLLRDDGGGTGSSTAATSGPVQLQGVGAYDPPPKGDSSEHGDDALQATDRDPGSAWTTESYNNFTKDGVGLVLKAPKAVALSKLTVVSTGSGFEAQIKGSNSPNSGFADVSGDFQQVDNTKLFNIDTNGKKYPYYMVWLKLPFSGGQASIAEVRAKT